MEWQGEIPFVNDSRFGAIQVHRIDPLDWRVLEQLEKPRTWTQVARVLDGVPEGPLRAVFERLRERRLVFEENEQYLSLIVDTGVEEGSI